MKFQESQDPHRFFSCYEFLNSELFAYFHKRKFFLNRLVMCIYPSREFKVKKSPSSLNLQKKYVSVPFFLLKYENTSKSVSEDFLCCRDFFWWYSVNCGKRYSWQDDNLIVNLTQDVPQSLKIDKVLIISEMLLRSLALVWTMAGAVWNKMFLIETYDSAAGTLFIN